jgi:hypothetical protein
MILSVIGIPLQVKDGINGWLVPPSEPSKTADKLYDFYTGKIKLDRPAGRPDIGRRRRDSLHFAAERRPVASTPRTPLTRTNSRRSILTEEPEKIKGGLDTANGSIEMGFDPNTVAERFVNDIGAPFPAVHPDSASPSEDYFTIGEHCLTSPFNH